MALVPPIDASPEEVRALLAPLRGDYAVAVCGENPFATGAIIRAAHNFLAREVILIGTGSFYEKASMGMEKYETLVHVPDVDAFFAHVAGRPIYAVEKDAATMDVGDVDRFPAGVVFVFGSEREGVPAAILARSACVIGIPIYGVNHSLPVAVAAGIVLHEWARRHFRGLR
jgi:tRNA G18 (ribose-2'-O)-methylase SpoU